MDVRWKDDPKLYHLLYMRKWGQKNREKIKEYYERHKLGYVVRRKQYRKEHPEKDKAHHNAHRDIPLKAKCERCGSTENLERHHPDYSKPNLVITLCSSCHKAVHKELLKDGNE